VAAKATPAIRPVAGPDDERVPVTGMCTIIADRLLASKTQIPHFYLNMEVDAAPLMQFRSHLNASSEKSGGNKYSVNDFILKAIVRAAQAVPAINAAWDGDAIVKFKHVGLSVAIAVEDGLVTPVIKSADTKTLLQISEAVKDLAVRSKSKKLSPDEFAGGTITVSNLGAFGIDSFSAIIIPPRLQSSAWAASAMCPSWARRVRSSPVNVCGSGSAAIIASSMAPSLPASLPRCAS